MSDSAEHFCCGRAMTSISVERPGSSLRLRSCPSCGRHSWHADGRELDRSTVLDALRVPERPAARRRPQPAVPGGSPAAAPALGEQSRRTELQQLLGGFTVHGTSS